MRKSALGVAVSGVLLATTACSPGPGPAGDSGVSTTPTVKTTPLKPVTVEQPGARKVDKKAPPKEVVYLTFDDGPDPTWTPKVLKVLQQEKVPATFFQLGPAVKQHPEVSQQLVKAGMSVQIHAWDHDYYTKHTPEWVERDLEKASFAITQATGVKPTCARPPYGEASRRVNKVYADQGLKKVMWQVDSRDWQRSGVRSIVRRATKDVQAGNVLLFHDGGGRRGQTVEALPEVIGKLKRQGYSFGLVCPAPRA